MYIIPQGTETFTYTANSEDLPTSGVEALCITSIVGTNPTPNTPRVGFVDVDAYKAANPGVTSVKVDGSNYSGAMYVKAIFPISEVTFGDGTYYNLQLNFAGAEVYYKENKYYTEEDKEIVIEFETGKDQITPKPDKGEPINPDADTAIGLTVQVIAWPATTQEENLGDEPAPAPGV